MTKFIMPMKCPKCGRDISQPILACPFCGAPYHIKDKIKVIILGFFRNPPKNELEDSPEIRKWKRIESITRWIGTTGGTVLTFFGIFRVHQLLNSLKNNEATKISDSLERFHSFGIFMQIGGIIVIVAITVFMVASSKINKARIIQKQKLQK